MEPIPAGDGAEATLPTNTLVERAVAGSPEAIEALCARYRPRLVGWARGRLPVAARGLVDTDDIVQETLVNSLRHLDGLDHREHGFLHYVRTALRNRILNAVRDAKRRPGRGELDDNLISPAPSPIDEVIGREAEERFNDALERLDPVDREMIIARIELHMPWADIAIHFGKPSPSAARQATNRAIEKLARDMDGNGTR